MAQRTQVLVLSNGSKLFLQGNEINVVDCLRLPLADWDEICEYVREERQKQAVAIQDKLIAVPMFTEGDVQNK